MQDYFDECMRICTITTNIKQMNFWECIEVKGLGNLIAKLKCKLEKKTLFVNFQGVLLGKSWDKEVHHLSSTLEIIEGC
jgi:hypothetical protein